METQLFKSVFSAWQTYRADGQTLSLDDLVKRGMISLLKDNLIVADFEQSDLRVIGASEEPARLLGLDKHGLGITVDQVWKSPKIAERRRKIFSICKDLNVPVFFSGNGPIPWHSNSYACTIDQYVSTRLDRLLIPVTIDSKTGAQSAILQILEFRHRYNLPTSKNDGLSEEQRAANLDFIGNVSVAI